LLERRILDHGDHLRSIASRERRPRALVVLWPRHRGTPKSPALASAFRRCLEFERAKARGAAQLEVFEPSRVFLARYCINHESRFHESAPATAEAFSADAGAITPL
jgi:hypothetical protein